MQALIKLGVRVAIAAAVALLLWSIASLYGEKLLVAEAASLSAILNVLGVEHVRLGRTIYLRYMGEVAGFRIEWHCSGLVSYTIFFILSILLPMRLRKRIYWLVVGFFILYLANVLRILVVLLVFTRWGLDVTARAHMLVGPILLLGSVAALLALEVAELIKAPRTMAPDAKKAAPTTRKQHSAQAQSTSTRIARMAGLAGGILWFVMGLIMADTSLRVILHLFALDSGATAATRWTVVMLYTMLGGALTSVYAAKVFNKIVLASSSSWRRFHPNILPTVSIVIPVYNGERTIGRVLRALLEQDYPHELMEVIVVDDGSTDDTWLVVKEYAEKYPFIKALRHMVNLGKSEALTTGIRAARGDIIVTLDADTIPDKTAIRRLVARLAYDDSLGAVCGRLAPAGTGGLLYWMQRIEYLLSFELGRFVDEALDRVNLILSGAFTAFRSTVLKPLAVLGVPSDTAAEDFELTVLVWKKGLRTGYEHYAVAYTAIPTDLRSLYRQRLRWYGGGLQVLLKHSNILKLRKARHPFHVYGRLLAIRLLGIEYLLPLLHIVGYITLAVAIQAYKLFGVEVFAMPLESFVAACLAAIASTVILGTINIVIAFAAEYGAKHAARVAPYALLYTLFYIPFLAVAKTDSIVRVLLGSRLEW